jgi:hypothetical protein
VLLTAGDEIARVPETACVRIDAGAGEVDALVEAMRLLVLFPQFRCGIGRAAATHIGVEHAVDRIAVRYWETLADAV